MTVGESMQAVARVLPSPKCDRRAGVFVLICGNVEDTLAAWWCQPTWALAAMLSHSLLMGALEPQPDRRMRESSHCCLGKRLAPRPCRGHMGKEMQDRNAPLPQALDWCPWAHHLPVGERRVTAADLL